jgi:hypothetical protein
MINYVGRVGHNQHKKLPGKVSEKSSYPLPRDIIVRSLARMDVSILPELFLAMDTNTPDVVSELIDAVGFLLFYHPEEATLDRLTILLQLMEKYASHSLIRWKCITALSAFPLPEAVAALQHLIAHADNELMAAEAWRSLSILSR